MIVIIMKHQPFASRIRGFLTRESEQGVQKKLDDLKVEKDEALKRYYRRVMGESELNDIVNDIKKRQFALGMRIKRMRDKGGPKEGVKPPPKGGKPSPARYSG